MEAIYPFPEHIIIEKRPAASLSSSAIYAQGPIDRCLVMWVDGSATPFRLEKGASWIAASAVRYLDLSTKSWVESVTLNTLPYGARFVFEAELIAVYEAFRIAHRLAEHIDRLIILSDCQAILNNLRKQSQIEDLATPGLADKLLLHANSLYDLGIIVEIRWVPAHSLIEGNELVDELATRVRRSAQLILAKEDPLPVLDNLNLSSNTWESLCQALLGRVLAPFEGKIRRRQKSRAKKTASRKVKPNQQAKIRHYATSRMPTHSE